MGKRIVLLMILVFLCMSVLTLRFEFVKASGTIYIMADGSVDPPTAPIQHTGNTYTLTDNIYGGPIVVGRDGIVVDGAGYTVQGTGSGKGFELFEKNHVTIKNTEIGGFDTAVYLYQSSNNAIVGNRITNSTYGMKLDYYSNYNSISGNSVRGNRRRGVALGPVACNNNIRGNNITNQQFGVFLETLSNNNTIWQNNLADNYAGITLSGYSNFNSIVGNTITNNSVALKLFTCQNNSISGNDITKNSGVGIVLSSSCNNTVLHNNFAENQQQASTDASCSNLWDDGVEGNYWNNYTGADNNQDGVGDSSFVINANNTDNHPLMGLFSSFNTSKGDSVTVVSNSTVEDFQCFPSTSTIRMHVSNTTANQTFGFCRVCIPHALMNETYHVTVNDAEPYNVNYTLYDDGSSRWIYLSYEHSTREIVIVSEFSLATILLLLVTITTVVAAFYKREHHLLDKNL